jgi:hypothetical protein
MQLSQKLTRLVTKMLYDQMRKERVRVCKAIMVMIASTS